MKPTVKYGATFLVLAGIVGIAYVSALRDTSPTTSSPIVWKSYNEGVAIARSSNKKILVDVYTDWCSWCKKMDAEVYTNKDVIESLNQHFVAVKLNAESGDPITFAGKTYTEAEFARQLGVTGYPTTLFFDQNSNPITEFSGYAIPERFAKVLDFIGKDYYKTISFQEYLKSNPTLR